MFANLVGEKWDLISYFAFLEFLVNLNSLNIYLKLATCILLLFIGHLYFVAVYWPLVFLFWWLLYLSVLCPFLLKERKWMSVSHVWLFVTSLGYPWNSPCQNTGVAFPFSRGSSQPGDRTQGLLHCRWILYFYWGVPLFFFVCKSPCLYNINPISIIYAVMLEGGDKDFLFCFSW